MENFTKGQIIPMNFVVWYSKMSRLYRIVKCIKLQKKPSHLMMGFTRWAHLLSFLKCLKN